jgi:DNA-binding MarR family transcriptional regulator
MLDQLSGRGLLKRVRSSVDRRLQHPHLTRSGEKLLEQANQLAATMEQQILEVLTSAERAILIELLQKLVT